MQLDAKIIWFPTHDAQNEKKFNQKIGGIEIKSTEGKPVQPEVYEILEMIKMKDVILSTGHLSFYEIVNLLTAANEVGVKKKLVNHPGIIFQRFSIDQQKELIKLGAILEHSYARPPHTLGWDELAESVKTLKPENIVLATDLGQPQNPDPVTGMQEIWKEMIDRGCTKQELKIMTCENPARLLGI